MGMTKKVVIGITSTALAAAATLTFTAAPATAVGASKCSYVYNHLDTMKTKTSGVNLRTGPSSTKYVSKGHLGKGVKIKEKCWDGNWMYGKVKSGGQSGKWGWTHIDYIKVA